MVFFDIVLIPLFMQHEDEKLMNKLRSPLDADEMP